MDPITLVVAALAAGASSGIAGVASETIRDAYSALKKLVIGRLSQVDGPVPPASLVAGHEANPETYQAPLEAELRASGAESDVDVVAAARRLMALVDPEGTAVGKYTVDLRGATGVQVGDHGTMTVNVTPPPEPRA